MTSLNSGHLNKQFGQYHHSLISHGGFLTVFIFRFLKSYINCLFFFIFTFRPMHHFRLPLYGTLYMIKYFDKDTICCV